MSSLAAVQSPNPVTPMGARPRPHGAASKQLTLPWIVATKGNQHRQATERCYGNHFSWVSCCHGAGRQAMPGTQVSGAQTKKGGSKICYCSKTGPSVTNKPSSPSADTRISVLYMKTENPQMDWPSSSSSSSSSNPFSFLLLLLADLNLTTLMIKTGSEQGPQSLNRDWICHHTLTISLMGFKPFPPRVDTICNAEVSLYAPLGGHYYRALSIHEHCLEHQSHKQRAEQHSKPDIELSDFEQLCHSTKSSNNTSFISKAE